jgi:hypothetical protein
MPGSAPSTPTPTAFRDSAAARRLERQIQGRVDRANRRYDTQTAHGTNATVQQTWETSIRAAKRRANGTIVNLP